MILMLTPIC